MTYYVVLHFTSGRVPEPESDTIVRDLILRDAQEEDLEAIFAIESQVYPMPWTFNFFRIILNMNKNLFVVATLDEEVIGYTIGEIETMGKTNVPRRAGHILNVAVGAKHQGKYIGTILLDEMEKRFKEHGAKIAYLEVRESNINAQRVYTKRGYQYVRIAKNYYGDENGLILTKKLTR